MKIKKLAITILMTTFFIILGTKAYATTGTINSKTVNLKKQPDSKTILEYLNKGDEVEILDYEDGWYKVKAQTELGKITGYVSEEFIDTESIDNIETSVEEPDEIENTEIPVEDNEEQSTPIGIATNIEENAQYILTEEIMVKRLPLINSSEKAKLTGNITVIEIINDWVKVENDTENGWIRKNALKEVIDAIKQEVVPNQEETQTKDQQTNIDSDDQQTQENLENTTTGKSEETETITKIGYVSAEGLRVRKEASTDSEEIDSLSKNDEVEIVGKTGNWYKINLNGKVGYVSAKYISDTKLAETTSRSGSTLKNESTKVEETSKEENTANEETAESTVLGTQVVEYAKKYLGYKYVSGGASPEAGFDCSGFTSYIYKHFGISLYRTSKDQIKNGIAVEESDLQLGDIVIFNNDANTAIGHVGIYVGNGNFIHASNPSDGVKITTLKSGYYHIRYVGARRVI